MTSSTPHRQVMPSRIRPCRSHRDRYHIECSFMRGSRPASSSRTRASLGPRRDRRVAPTRACACVRSRQHHRCGREHLRRGPRRQRARVAVTVPATKDGVRVPGRSGGARRIRRCGSSAGRWCRMWPRRRLQAQQGDMMRRPARVFDAEVPGAVVAGRAAHGEVAAHVDFARRWHRRRAARGRRCRQRNLCRFPPRSIAVVAGTVSVDN